ncbi:hypothetical protein J3R83DRAFT_8545 [Lanmaoa asiatica]|nr:hypothetical protein J3R83DRAFT_8545 [Lanmaoa asiatica]
MSSATPENISLSINFRGTSHKVSLPPDVPLTRLEAQLEELTSVPPSLQKLLFRGKKVQHADDLTLAQIGLRDGLKVQLLGSTAQEINSLNVTEAEHQRKERILRERALKPQAKVRSTGSSTVASTTYVFHKIEPLGHLPKPETALERLLKLSNDPAIRHIMQKHKFSVGVLTELAPHEQPHLLGLNVGAGQSIKLRIRTDCFKELNSQLNREVAEFETAEKRGTHYLSDLRGAYEPSSNEEAEVLIHVLGGNGIPLGDSAEDRRHRALEAATARLRREEEELEKSCGTSIILDFSWNGALATFTQSIVTSVILIPDYPLTFVAFLHIMKFTSQDLDDLRNGIAQFSSSDGRTIGKAGSAYLRKVSEAAKGSGLYMNRPTIEIIWPAAPPAADDCIPVVKAVGGEGPTKSYGITIAASGQSTLAGSPPQTLGETGEQSKRLGTHRQAMCLEMLGTSTSIFLCSTQRQGSIAPTSIKISRRDRNEESGCKVRWLTTMLITYLTYWRDSIRMVQAGANPQLLQWHLKRVGKMVSNDENITEAVEALLECTVHLDVLSA